MNRPPHNLSAAEYMEGNEMRKWIEHIIKENSRNHVISWDNFGAKCSEPNCEINKARKGRKQAPKDNG